ncbi:MAG: SDR family oxidoreductase [Dehalococcoidia bacterium]|jgi:3-oxoacyl-[acyl-carrier protein] reductase|nr:SDR family oxidoreductase [Dehalococcoidia bacterium]
MDMGIEGRVALVTGGSRGLGRQAALTLGREGCRVAICARSAEGLNETVEEMKEQGLDVVGIQADVATAEGTETFYQESEKTFGQVDIIVNNVGGTRGGRDFDTTTDQDWHDTLDLNLLSAVRLTRLGLPGMKERRWGRIVNIASIWGREHGGGLTYMTAKAALIAFSKHMALSLAPYNVLVNTLAPGSIQFPGGGWDRFVNGNSEEVVQEFVARHLPMGKFGWPEPVGAMVAFLCSEGADLITGTSINVDGGQSKSLI